MTGLGGPTLPGFISFVRNVVGIDSAILPDNSIYFGWALASAMALVNPQILAACALPTQDSVGNTLIPSPGPLLYTQAVYNLGADNLFNYAQDLNGAPPVEGSKPPMPFFQWSRKQWNINGFVSGVIDSSSDEGTSQHLVVQEAAKNFTLSNLQNLKTPWGRQYLALAQSAGPETWGLS